MIISAIISGVVALAQKSNEADAAMRAGMGDVPYFPFRPPAEIEAELMGETVSAVADKAVPLASIVAVAVVAVVLLGKGKK